MKYSKATITQYRSRYRRLELAIAAGILTPDQTVLAAAEMHEIALKIGIDGVTPPQRGRPRVKLELRGEDLRTWERLQREGVVKLTTDYSPEATRARALERLGITTEESEQQLRVMQAEAAKVKGEVEQAQMDKDEIGKLEREIEERDELIRKANDEMAERARKEREEGNPTGS